MGILLDLLFVGLAVALWSSVGDATDWLAKILPEQNIARFANLIRLLWFALAIVFAAAAGLRLQSRFLIPVLMNALSRAGTHAWIAAAHLRSKKSSFLTAIGFLAMFAVCLSSCSLTTTLSIFGGFRHDLRQKILANTAHIIVDEQPEGEASRDASSRTLIENWSSLHKAIRDHPGVTGAAPVVEGEVMISSATQQAGAVMRGVPPDQLASVSDVPKNIRRGDYKYFKDPASLPASIWRLASPGDPSRGSIFDLESDDAGAKSGGDAGVVSDAGPTHGRSPPTRPEKKVPPVLLMGEEMARTLRVFVGDEVTLVTPFGTLGPSGPLPKSRTFRVAGIFYTGMYEFDMKHVYTSLEDGQRFLGLGDNIHSVEGRVAEPLEVIPIRKSLEEALQGKRDELSGGRTRSGNSQIDGSGGATSEEPKALRVRDWQDQNRTLFGALALEKLAIFIVLTIAIAVAGFCIVCTMLLMIQEKRSEVGVMRAIGAGKPDILKVFLIEGLVLGLVGTVFGLEGGFLLGFAMQNLGVAMDPGVYYIDRLPVHMDAGEFALVGTAATVVCVLATMAPAWLATINRPIDAIREL